MEPREGESQEDSPVQAVPSEPIRIEREKAQLFLVNCGAVAYNLVMTYFRAQGALCDYKRLVLSHLRYLMLISEGRHKAAAKKVYCDSVLQKVAEALNPGLDVNESWKIESDLSSQTKVESDKLSLPKNLAKFADALNYEQSLRASACWQSLFRKKRRASESISDLAKLGLKRKRMWFRNSPCRTATNAVKLKTRKTYELRKRLSALTSANRARNRLSGSRLNSIRNRQGQATRSRSTSSVDGEKPSGDHVVDSEKVTAKKLVQSPVIDLEKVNAANLSKNLRAEVVADSRRQSREMENPNGQLMEEFALARTEKAKKFSSSKLDLFADRSVYNQLFDEYYGGPVREKRNTSSSSSSDAKADKNVPASNSISAEDLSTPRKQIKVTRVGRTEVPDFVSPIDLFLSGKPDQHRNQGGSTSCIRKEIAQAFPAPTDALQTLKNRNFHTSPVQYWETSTNAGKLRSQIKHDVIGQQLALRSGNFHLRQDLNIPAGPRILKARAISQPILNGNSSNYDLSRNSFHAAIATHSSHDTKPVGDDRTRKLILTRRPGSFQVSDGAPRSVYNPRISIINRMEDRTAACKVTSFFAADSRINVLRMPVTTRARNRFEKYPAPAIVQVNSVRHPGHTVVCSQSSSNMSASYGARNDRFQSRAAVKAYYVASQRPAASNCNASMTSSSQAFRLVRPTAGRLPAKNEAGSAYRLVPTATESKAQRFRLQVKPANGEKSKPAQPIVSSTNNVSVQATSGSSGVRLVGKTGSKMLAGVKVAFRERKNDTNKLTFKSNTSARSSM
ncbi:ENT domain containing protein [Trichuris trichiura]|uniref:ENT domain containing protein n=1 Tax=Trichuris trichiura TaxID=36087 RepID=A0A077ZCB9_TRITR|nr:ENT domain containing protein [Trichuris trichiura]